MDRVALRFTELWALWSGLKIGKDEGGSAHGQIGEWRVVLKLVNSAKDLSRRYDSSVRRLLLNAYTNPHSLFRLLE